METAVGFFIVPQELTARLQALERSQAIIEFDLDGTYLATDAPHPPARGQTYSLRVGAFFELRDGLIARVSNHYNVADWLAQVR